MKSPFKDIEERARQYRSDNPTIGSAAQMLQAIDDIEALLAAYRTIAADAHCPAASGVCYVNDGVVPDAENPAECNTAECWLYHVQRGDDAG